MPSSRIGERMHCSWSGLARLRVSSHSLRLPFWAMYAWEARQTVLLIGSAAGTSGSVSSRPRQSRVSRLSTTSMEPSYVVSGLMRKNAFCQVWMSRRNVVYASDEDTPASSYAV